jgi:outer membrane protein assembly factor BamB
VLRGSVAWVCRGFLVAVLLGAGSSGAQAAGAQPGTVTCAGGACARAGTIRWQELLPGGYVVNNDSRGTEPVAGEPYAAIGPQVAVFGLGTTVSAYDATTGAPRWSVQIPARPAGGRIVSARVWPGVATVGLGAAPGAGPAGAAREIVLSAATGRLIRSYPAAAFGGTVAADTSHTVVVGPGAVTSYDNANGRARWTRQTGTAAQRWQLDGHMLYVTVAAGGYLGTQPVTALRRIDVRTGKERIIRPRSGSFAGTLSAALDSVVLFSGPTGVTAYSGNTGRLLWHVAGATPQAIDAGQQRFFLSVGSGLIAVDPGGAATARLPASAGLYGERSGVAFGLDQGASGEAWGLDTASQHVVWSTSPLPWPHVFVDFSGIGGSADSRSDVIILATCAQADLDAAPPQCVRPELVAVDR